MRTRKAKTTKRKTKQAPKPKRRPRKAKPRAAAEPPTEARPLDPPGNPLDAVLLDTDAIDAVGKAMKEQAKKPAPNLGAVHIEINGDLVEKLAAILCTHEEIAAIVGCSKETLVRRFAFTMRKGRQVGKASLRRQQYRRAMGGNVSMLIWLGKQVLGQRNEVRISQDPMKIDRLDTGKISTEDLHALEEILSRAEKVGAFLEAAEVEGEEDEGVAN